jgi:hypothetical protein
MEDAMRRGTTCVLGLLLLAGCNNSNGNPAGTNMTVVSISISSNSGAMARGATETFTATATLAGGGTQPVTGGAWGSDNPAVAQVTGNGSVMAAGLGTATVFVDFQGVRGTRLIRVLPGFGGGYEGTYLINGCTESEDFVGFCADVFPPGMSLPVAFAFDQNGAALSGLTALGQIISNPFNATVRDDGGVTVTAVANFAGVVLTETWELRADEPGSLTGTMHLVVTAPGANGNATVDVTIESAVLTAASAPAFNAMPAAGGDRSPAAIGAAIRANVR